MEMRVGRREHEYGGIPVMTQFAWTYLKKSASTIACGSVGLLLCMGGCRDCDERLCHTVKILQQKAVNLSDECCQNPESERCTNLYERFDRMLELILVADDACHAGNIEILKGVWHEFKELVPPNWILLLCDEYRDLDQWIENECRPYYNSAVVLGLEDSIDVDVHLVEVSESQSSKLGAAWQGHGGLPSDANSAGRNFIVAPGSHTSAETWAGSADFGVSGTFAMSSLEMNDAGYLQATATQLAFDFIDAESGVAGSIVLDRSLGESIVLVDTRGVGVLGAAVLLDVYAIDDPELSLSGYVDTAWIEIPVVLRKRGIQLGGVGPISGFDFAPIHPDTNARLASAEDGVPVLGPEHDEVDPCAPISPPEGEDQQQPWPARSVQWYTRIMNMYPQCFTD